MLWINQLLLGGTCCTRNCKKRVTLTQEMGKQQSKVNNAHVDSEQILVLSHCRINDREEYE